MQQKGSTHSNVVDFREDSFGKKDGQEISNKNTILAEIDKKLNPLNPKPPSLELLYTKPYASLSLGIGYGVTKNPYGHLSIRYVVPSTGKDIVMNIGGWHDDVPFVNFVPTTEYLFSTKNWDKENEQGGAYNRGFVGFRIEKLPDEKIEALHNYFSQFKQKKSTKEKSDYSLFSSVKNWLSGEQKYGNSSFWASKGLVHAQILSQPSMWPKSVWTSAYEKYAGTDKKQLTTSNTHIVNYKRIRGVNSYGADVGCLIQGVKPFDLRREYLYRNLGDLADIDIVVPTDEITAHIIANPKFDSSHSQFTYGLNTGKLFSLFATHSWQLCSPQPPSSLPGQTDAILCVTIGNPVEDHVYLLTEVPSDDEISELYKWKSIERKWEGVLQKWKGREGKMVKLVTARAGNGLWGVEKKGTIYRGVWKEEEGNNVSNSAVEWEELPSTKNVFGDDAKIKSIFVLNENHFWVIDTGDMVYEFKDGAYRWEMGVSLSEICGVSEERIYGISVKDEKTEIFKRCLYVDSPSPYTSVAASTNYTWVKLDITKIFGGFGTKPTPISELRIVHFDVAPNLKYPEFPFLLFSDVSGNFYVYNYAEIAFENLGNVSSKFPITIGAKGNGYGCFSVNSAGQIVGIVDGKQTVQIYLRRMNLRTVRKYKKIWDDRGTRAQFDLAFFRGLITVKEGNFPENAEGGWKIVGDLAERTQLDDPMTEVYILREVPGTGAERSGIGFDLLAQPTGFSQVWNDLGSRGTFGKVSVWRMEAPVGYVGLGDVVVGQYGVKPDVKDFRCVQKRILGIGEIYDADWLWQTEGTKCKEPGTIWLVKNEVGGMPPCFFVAVKGVPKRKGAEWAVNFPDVYCLQKEST